jgi:hypothetical protein
MTKEFKWPVYRFALLYGNVGAREIIKDILKQDPTLKHDGINLKRVKMTEVYERMGLHIEPNCMDPEALFKKSSKRKLQAILLEATQQAIDSKRIEDARKMVMIYLVQNRILHSNNTLFNHSSEEY